MSPHSLDRQAHPDSDGSGDESPDPSGLLPARDEINEDQNNSYYEQYVNEPAYRRTANHSQ